MKEINTVAPRANSAPAGKKRYAFIGEEGGGLWRWWEQGNWPDVFDVLTEGAMKDRRAAYEAAGHEVWDGIPAYDEMAQERLDEIEAELGL